MTIQDAIESGRPFRRPGHGFWLGVEDNTIIDYEDREDYYLTVDDIIADDWEIKEEWYEGNFKEKYPNGVLCWVWERGVASLDIVIDYLVGSDSPFRTRYAYFKHVEPVKKNEAPVIIGDEL